MTDRFVLEEHFTSFVRIYDRQLDCRWVIGLSLWFAINDTDINNGERCKMITEVLYDEAVNCIVSK